MNNTAIYRNPDTTAGATDEAYVRVRDGIVLAALLLLSMLPLSTTGNIIRFAVVAVSFFVVGAYRLDRPTLNIAFIAAVGFALAYITVGLSEEGSVDYSVYVHEAMRTVFIFFMVFTVRKLHVSLKYACLCGFILIVVNTVIQILQYFHVDAVMTFLRNNYVMTGDAWSHLNLAYGTGTNFRAGSVFINPNVYMVIPVVVMCMVLELNRRNFTVKGLVMCSVCVLSSIMTGSRTTTVVIAVILAYYIIRYLSGAWKATFIVILLVALLPNWAYLVDTFRAFSFDTLSDGSLVTKLRLYYGFIITSGPQYWLFGSLGSNAVFNSMDSETTYIAAYYGIAGIAWYTTLLGYSYKINKTLKFYSVALIVVLLLSGLTATIFLCMPVCSLIISLGFVNYNDVPENENPEELPAAGGTA